MCFIVVKHIGSANILLSSVVNLIIQLMYDLQQINVSISIFSYVLHIQIKKKGEMRAQMSLFQLINNTLVFNLVSFLPDTIFCRSFYLLINYQERKVNIQILECQQPSGCIGGGNEQLSYALLRINMPHHHACYSRATFCQGVFPPWGSKK